MSFSKIETISTIAERAITIIKDGDSARGASIDERDVMSFVRNILSAKMRGDIQQAFVDGEETVSEQFVGTFELPVQEDSNGECFVDMSYSYLNLYNHRGIQRVAPIRDDGAEDRAMIPIAPYEMDIYKDLNAGKEVVRQWCYYPVRGKLRFERKQGKNLKTVYPKVAVSMVTIDPNLVGNDEPLPLPANYYYETLTEVLKILGFQQENKES
jgi:hypothetical protein